MGIMAIVRVSIEETQTEWKYFRLEKASHQPDVTGLEAHP